MENKRGNFEKDKILEDILDNVSKGTTGQSSYSRTQYSRKNTSRNSGGSNIPRKTINPAARTSSISNTGFATTNKTSTIPQSHNYTEKIPNNSENTGYQERTVNIRRPASDTGNLSNAGRVSERTGMRNTNYTRRQSIPENQHTTKTSTKIPAGESVTMERKAPVRRKSRRRSGRLPIILMLTTFIVTVAICLSVLIIAVGRDMLAIGKDESIKMVTITEGADAKKVAQILYDEKIIKIPKAFEVISKMSNADQDFIPGEYELSPSDAYETIITKLTTDMSEIKESVDITFVEGISIYDAAQKLEEEGVCDAERFIYYFNAGGYGFEFENRLPTNTASKFYRMEGYLFPDTYSFYLDSDPESVCMKIYQNFENKMTDEYYKQMDKMGMTLDEVITLASIVQKEAHEAESMKKIASVFENRLADPDDFPKLESDPTTYYVDEVIRPNIEIPSDAIFEAYDTYKGNGLPPGAICNPGINAIKAVLYPDKTNYYFFCANIDTNEIYYAETNDEHEQNLETIRQEQAYADNGENGDEEY